jgi:hypothetical protein
LEWMNFFFSPFHPSFYSWWVNYFFLFFLLQPAPLEWVGHNFF